MGIFRTRTYELFQVEVQSTTCRSGPYIVLHTIKGAHPSDIIGSYLKGKILKVYEIKNGFGRISRRRSIWVPLKDLIRV